MIFAVGPSYNVYEKSSKYPAKMTKTHFVPDKPYKLSRKGKRANPERAARGSMVAGIRKRRISDKEKTGGAKCGYLRQINQMHAGSRNDG